MSVTVIVLVIIGLVALLIFLIIANNRDKKKLEKSLNEPDLKSELRDRRDQEEKDPN